jgi:hypothetical protein
MNRISTLQILKFAVNAEKGAWHSFGCGRSGNYYSFREEWKTLHRGVIQPAGGHHPQGLIEEVMK